MFAWVFRGQVRLSLARVSSIILSAELRWLRLENLNSEPKRDKFKTKTTKHFSDSLIIKKLQQWGKNFSFQNFGENRMSFLFVTRFSGRKRYGSGHNFSLKEKVNAFLHESDLVGEPNKDFYDRGRKPAGSGFQYLTSTPSRISGSPMAKHNLSVST